MTIIQPISNTGNKISNLYTKSLISSQDICNVKQVARIICGSCSSCILMDGSYVS